MWRMTRSERDEMEFLTAVLAIKKILPRIEISREKFHKIHFQVNFLQKSGYLMDVVRPHSHRLFKYRRLIKTFADLRKVSQHKAETQI